MYDGQIREYGGGAAGVGDNGVANGNVQRRNQRVRHLRRGSFPFLPRSRRRLSRRRMGVLRGKRKPCGIPHGLRKCYGVLDSV